MALIRFLKSAFTPSRREETPADSPQTEINALIDAHLGGTRGRSARLWLATRSGS